MTKPMNDADMSDDLLAKALRDLPQMEPGELAVTKWTRAAAAATAEHPMRSKWRDALPMAMAATLVLAFVVARYIAIPATPDSVAALPQSATDSQRGDVAMARDELPTYVAQAALLEQALARIPSEGRVRSVSQASAIVSLEDRLALIARTIDNPPTPVSYDSRQRLWRERVDVMATLVNLKQGDGREDRNVWL